ncbi:nardilysin-like [Tropilaelaps mercedesae]|uniref:Nardilysin-like n=1 Tax=Tropilaelaps mercedesae TaxID=418985 RepID=A0A1V9XM40_9ACAR|nr:nardilysin-like [Tropilaelaps mercedesae]
MLTSENDHREYRVVELENGLISLLVRGADPNTTRRQRRGTEDGKTHRVIRGSRDNDDDTNFEKSSRSSQEGESTRPCPNPFTEKMAAASLTVRCGSLQDPKDIGGVAHYLEHMLFLGSEKYPKENEYMKFISQQGGTCNAFTGLDATSYYFKVPQVAFQTALDMFANFFVQPLLREDALDREVQAVNNEFLLHSQYDGTRVMEVLLRQAGNHPIGKFCWGNLRSLKEEPEKKGINMREVLVEFYNKFYSADVMTLAVQSQYSLDEMESFVKDSFSRIARRSRLKKEYPTELPYHNNPDFFKLFKIVPVSRRIALSFRWILPPQRRNYREKVFRYLKYIVSHEAPDGLLDSLRTQQWALELWAYATEDQEICSMFSIDLTLTEKGVDHLGEVTQYVHQYLHMVRHKGPQKWLWYELKQIAENNFRFKCEESAHNYVSLLSETMQYASKDHYLCSEELFFDYNPERLQMLINLMVPEKCNVVYTHYEFQRHINTFSRKEPWTGTHYEIEEFPKNWLGMWEDNPGFQEKLKLPQENSYVSLDFRIKTDSLEGIAAQQFPVILEDTETQKLWFRKDNRFMRPTGNVNILFATDQVLSNVQEAVYVDMLVDIFRLLIAREATYAEEASLSHSLEGSDLGLYLKFDGFNHRLPLFVDTVLRTLTSINCSDDMFKTVKKDRLKYYYNCAIDNADLAEDVWSFIVQPRNCLYHHRHSVLRGIKKSEFLEWCKEVFNSAFIEAYVHGNFTSSEAKGLLENVLSCFPATSKKKKPEPLTHVKVDGQTCIRILGLSSEARKSFITNHYIYGPAHFYEETLITLFVMIMEERCFTQLRTEEQLGYDPTCYARFSYRVIGFSIGLSPFADKFTLSDVDRKIEDFLDHMVVVFEELSLEEFDTVRLSLIKQKSCVDLSMDDEVSRNWSEIVDFRYIFDKLRLEINFLETLAMDKFQSWAARVIGPKREKRTKISVQVVGHGKLALEECEGGAQIWKDRASTLSREPDMKEMPPLKLLKPIHGLPHQKYVVDLESYCRSLQHYPRVVSMHPNAKFDF